MTNDLADEIATRDVAAWNAAAWRDLLRHKENWLKEMSDVKREVVPTPTAPVSVDEWRAWREDEWKGSSLLVLAAGVGIAARKIRHLIHMGLRGSQ